MDGGLHPPLVSAIVLSWTRRDELRLTLRHLASCTFSALETIVVDNASTDGSPEMVARDFPRVRLISLAENAGIAGLNAGMRAARGKYVILLDDDSHVGGKTVEEMVQRFEADPGLGIAAFTIINPVAKTVDWPGTGDLHADGSAPTFIGCGAGLRLHAVQRAGYFEAGYFLYVNELYLTARILDLGYSCRHFAELQAFHRVAPAHRSQERRAYYGTRNMLWFAAEMFGPAHGAAFAAIMVAEGVAYRLRRGRTAELISFLAGAKDGLRKFARGGERKPLAPATLEKLKPYFAKWYPGAWTALTFMRR
jgi:GT2 family glycosyltransferase